MCVCECTLFHHRNDITCCASAGLLHSPLAHMQGISCDIRDLVRAILTIPGYNNLCRDKLKKGTRLPKYHDEEGCSVSCIHAFASSRCRQTC